MNVLIVDDAAEVRTRLAALLAEIAGVEGIAQAADAEEALAVARSTAPHVILLDLHLRESTTLAILPRLREEHASSRLIVLTNDASDLHRRECVARGADFFFDKSRD